MSQGTEDEADTAEARTPETRGFMQQVRVAARRKYGTSSGGASLEGKIVSIGFLSRSAAPSAYLNQFPKSLNRDTGTIAVGVPTGHVRRRAAGANSGEQSHRCDSARHVQADRIRANLQWSEVAFTGITEKRSLHSAVEDADGDG